MKRLGKRENKNYRSVPFLICNRKFQNKIAKKLKKIPLLPHFQPKQVGNGSEICKIKIIVSFRFVSFLPDEQKKIPKKFEKLKNTIVDSFQAKIDWRRMRKRENKNYTSVTFLSDTLQKISKKIAK